MKTSMLRALAMVLALALSWLIGTSAHAGSLSISPLRIDFSAGRGLSAVTLTNQSRETMTIESEVASWPADHPEQRAGDVVITPPISTLLPGEKVTVRIGLVRRLPANVERSYRVYFTELPTLRAQEAQGVGVRLRLGIPLFVAAEKPQPQPLAWTAERGEADTLWLKAVNHGNVHQTVMKLAVQRAGTQYTAVQSSPYVLPAQTTQFRMQGLATRPGERLNLQVQMEDAARQFDVVVP